MFSKLKYILFDFSNNFKNNFLALFKKSIIFLIVGIVASIFSGTSEIIELISGGGIVIFGFMWGRNLFADLLGFSNLSNNIVIKISILIFAFTIGIFAGYIYFVWCLIKTAIIFVKNLSRDK